MKVGNQYRLLKETSHIPAGEVLTLAYQSPSRDFITLQSNLMEAYSLNLTECELVGQCSLGRFEELPGNQK